MLAEKQKSGKGWLHCKREKNLPAVMASSDPFGFDPHTLAGYCPPLKKGRINKKIVFSIISVGVVLINQYSIA